MTHEKIIVRGRCHGDLVAKFKLVCGDHGDVIVYCQYTGCLDLRIRVESV